MVKRGKALRIVVAHEKLTKVLPEKVKTGDGRRKGLRPRETTMSKHCSPAFEMLGHTGFSGIRSGCRCFWTGGAEQGEYVPGNWQLLWIHLFLTSCHPTTTWGAPNREPFCRHWYREKEERKLAEIECLKIIFKHWRLISGNRKNVLIFITSQKVLL